MSDEDKEFIDVESDEEGNSGDLQFANPADKRAHHNALERKRRDHIKESFNGLRDAIPGIQGEKVSEDRRKNGRVVVNYKVASSYERVRIAETSASRAQILKNATDYITNMKGKSNRHKSAIDELRNENKELEEQIMVLEQLVDSNEFASGHSVETFIEEAATLEEVVEPEYRPPRRKKAKN